MRRSPAPTLKDVAELAEVSIMLASVVLNGARSSARVSDATRTRIKEAAEQIGYRRNALAHALARNLVDTIGVVTSAISAEMNPYFLELFYGIMAAAAQYRQNVTVLSIDDWHQDHDRIMQFCDGRVDGIVFMAPESLPQPLFESFQSHTPFVTLHSHLQRDDVCNIDIDNDRGAYLIVQHLIAQGHRRIAHFSGNPRLMEAQARIDGYHRALQEAGILREYALILQANYSLEGGRRRTVELLEQTPPTELPTAIFCCNDTTAYGCLETLTSHGIRVPEQISVVGFDDSLMARLTQPALTTVCQPFRQMGMRAVDRLLPKIRNDIEPLTRKDAIFGTIRTLPNSDTEIFPVELIERQSVRQLA
jgi:LacI family transcriptional regulator